MYLWLKVVHLVFLISWMAGIFYLPRLFVYHANSNDSISKDRFVVMERKLYRGIMMPAMILTLLSGFGMLYLSNWILLSMPWMHAKLALVLALVAYHFVCNHYRLKFAAEQNKRSHIFYRWFNEVPVLLLIGIVIMIVIKPF